MKQHLKLKDAGQKPNRARRLRSVLKNTDLYLMLLPVIIYFIVFEYLPMYGISIAFKDFSPRLGIWGSEWAGFDHFQRFFKSFRFESLIKNTINMSLLSLIFGFPVPIIFALMVNELRSLGSRRVVQTVSYMPHFLSTVVVVSILLTFTSPSAGIINRILKALGAESIYFMADPDWFKPLYVISGIWQSFGWSSIIYSAAISSIDAEQFEAAEVDGATKMQKIRFITIPSIIPTAIIMLILQTGSIMSVGFEKVFLMQNDLNIRASEVISTYVYKVGLLSADFSFSAAVGFFNSVINFALIIIVNWVARRTSDMRLW